MYIRCVHDHNEIDTGSVLIVHGMFVNDACALSAKSARRTFLFTQSKSIDLTDAGSRGSFFSFSWRVAVAQHCMSVLFQNILDFNS